MNNQINISTKYNYKNGSATRDTSDINKVTSKFLTLEVAFVYEAIVIKPRCIKPTLITIKDKVNVQIRTATLDELPVALIIGDKSIRWDGERLWDLYLEQVVNGPDRKVEFAEVSENTKSNGTTYKYSCASAASPFKNFWHALRWSSVQLGPKHKSSETGFDKWITDEGLVEKSRAVYREWVEDNRNNVLDELNNIVDGLMSVDGIMYGLASEPRYLVNSFGAGRNYSVGMFISYGYNPNISNRAYFNALEFDKAQASYINRNPNKNEVAKPNCGNQIEVLIPAAVMCNPILDHVE